MVLFMSISICQSSNFYLVIFLLLVQGMQFLPVLFILGIGVVFILFLPHEYKIWYSNG